MVRMNESNATEANDYCKYNEPYSSVERAFQMAALTFFGGLGFFGNIFVILLAAKYTVRRNLHFLIINMAVSDIFVIITIILYASGIIGYKIWNDNIAANFRCKAVVFLGSTFEGITLVTLVIIAIERFRITRRRAVQISRPHSIKQRLCLLALSWLVSAAVHCYEAILRRSNDQGECFVEAGTQFVHSLLTLIRLILSILFFVVLFVLSIFTLRRLSSTQAIENNISEVQRKQRRQRIGSAVRMVLFSLLLYCFCYMPFFICQVFFAVGFVFPPAFKLLNLDGCIDWNSLYYITAFFLPVINSSLSPCVYFVCLSDFRQAANRLLCREDNNNNRKYFPSDSLSIKEQPASMLTLTRFEQLLD